MGVKKLLKFINPIRDLFEIVEIKESRGGATVKTESRVILADGSGFLMELHNEAMRLVHFRAMFCIQIPTSSPATCSRSDLR